MLKADASGAGTFCVVHVNWITKWLESNVSIPASHKRFHIHRFRLLVPCEMGQASSVEARLMERKRCLESTKQGEGEGRGGKAESVDPIPVFSLLKWARLTLPPVSSPHPTAPPSRCPPLVPTVPPGNVHTEATNSTTIRFTWNAPSPQFINGINQGYKVRGAPPHPQEEAWGFYEGDRRLRRLQGER